PAESESVNLHILFDPSGVDHERVLGAAPCARLVATTREYDVGETATEFGIPLILLLLLIFYGGTFLISLSIGKKSENADGYMTAGNNVGFGIAAGSMTATWIWASS